MAVYRLSKSADIKLDQIYEYSLLTFGERQADLYYHSLHDAFEKLANMPFLGRPFRGRRRHQHAEHVIFYRSIADGILILQIFHHAEDIERRLDPK